MSQLSIDNATEQVWNDAMVKTIEGSSFRMDIVWAYLRDKSSLLMSLALSALTFQHGNTVKEGVFEWLERTRVYSNGVLFKNFAEFNYYNQNESTRNSLTLLLHLITEWLTEKNVKVLVTSTIENIVIKKKFKLCNTDLIFR